MGQKHNEESISTALDVGMLRGMDISTEVPGTVVVDPVVTYEESPGVECRVDGSNATGRGPSTVEGRAKN